ncbi:MAG: hypothetical protein QOI56_1332 [Actinomycetota bacterium]|nr:hypothetical protein [Actinomycetota bacterium]
MIAALVIVIPCCLVGLLVYAGMSRWELPTEAPSFHSGGGRPDLPHLTLRETVVDWPVPQFERLPVSVLTTISAVLAVWILGWIVVFFIGLGMLHG